LANKVTDRGLHVSKQWERFRPTESGDGWTASGRPIRSKGFGHSNLLETVPFDEGVPWTEEYAHEVLLNHDLPYFYNLLRPHLKIDVPDEMWSIFGSLAMNKGAKGLYTSEPWQILHDGQEYPFERFCESILKYAIIAPNKLTKEPEEKRGLRWRRIAEAGIYLQDRSKDYL
jgi:hypothetical protein